MTMNLNAFSFSLCRRKNLELGFFTLLRGRKPTLFNSIQSRPLCAPTRNTDIRYPTLRVVYKDVLTGENTWKIMSRKEALAFASESSLDLVLVSPNTDPPVCRLDNYGKMVMEQRKKEKERRAAEKARSLKEIIINALIDPHDLQIKLKKCHDFLAKGHQVKLSIIAKTAVLKKNPLILEEMVLKVFDEFENEDVTVSQQTGANSDAAMGKRDFILNLKTK